MSRVTRRAFVAAGGLALGGACGRRHGSGYAGFALVATAGETSVSVVDLAEFRLLKQVGVRGAPKAIAVAGPGRASYVLTPDTGSVHALDSEFVRVRSWKYADELAGFALAPDGKSLLILASGLRQLIEVDAETLRVKRRWKLAAKPESIDVSRDGSRVAISSGARGLVELVDLRTGAQSWKELGGVLGEVRFRADGQMLLAANLREQTISLLEAPGLAVVAELPVAMTPENLCFNFDGGQLFVSGRGMDAVAVIFPYRTLEVEQTVLAGRAPGAMVCSEDPEYLFAASAGGSDVCILSVDSRKMIGVVEVGQEPTYLAVTPDSQYALVLDEKSADMAVIHGGTIPTKLGNAAKMRGKLTASLFTMLPVGTRPVQVAIVAKTG